MWAAKIINLGAWQPAHPPITKIINYNANLWLLRYSRVRENRSEYDERWVETRKMFNLITS